VALLICGIEQEGKRHFEHVGDFDRVRRQRKRRLDPADDRRHAVPGHRLVLGEMAENRDLRRRKADFFGCLAQRRCHERRVFRLDASAGKADLARMVGQRRAALRQQHLQPRGAVDERDENGRGRWRALAPGKPEAIGQIERRRWRGTRERLDEPVALCVGRKIEQREGHRTPRHVRRDR
jgi:hypothetical protein